MTDAEGAETLADALQKVEVHESAAHEQRNWVRLTYDCNNHCIFCLDSLAHDGRIRATMDIKAQIISGRKQGATRLILSGGEPTMHPNFLDFVKLGSRAGYRKVQTVTNGRMFAYPEFLSQAADNGLHEITFSLHGHTAKLHDTLVGTQGAFEQEVRGLQAALASGRFIVNVDIVINKMNVAHLPDMLETFIGWGVREFDLLHIIPFGTAWGSARKALFYDLEGNEDALRRAFEYARRPDVHVWLNRFPPPFTEGFEDLIQDPYKMNDEVRGRREELDAWTKTGEPLRCREPERCHYCYLKPYCDGLEAALTERARTQVDLLRVVAPGPALDTLPEATVAHVVAPDLAAALPLLRGVRAEGFWLSLEDWAGVDATSAGERVRRVLVTTGEALLALRERLPNAELCAVLNRSTASVLGQLPPTRLVVTLPTYDRVTDNHKHDVDVRATLAELPPEVRTFDVPPCLGGREPERHERVLDTARLGHDGRVEVRAYTARFVEHGYRTKSRRCATCAYDVSCPGVHLNFVRAHGYAPLEPLGQVFRSRSG